MVPQRRGLVLVGQPADHRPEEGDTPGRFEVDDRRTDVLARQGQCLVGLGLDLGVAGRVVEGVGERRRQAGFGERVGGEAGGALPAGGLAFVGAGFEDARAEGRVERADRLTAVLLAGRRRDAQQPQARGVLGVVLRGKWVS